MPTLSIEDMLKKKLLMYGNDPALNIDVLPFDIPKIDEVLGGGLPRGRNTLFVGDYSSGKTFLSQLAIKATQLSGGVAAYIDAERSFDSEWFAATGVDVDTLLVSVPEYGERAVDVCVGLLEAGVDCVVLDSIAALIPSVEEDESAEKQTIGLHARLVSKAFKKITVANKRSIFIGINQIRREIGPYGKETYPGGAAQTFFAHLILRIKREHWIEEDHNKLGFEISCTAVKNKVAEPWKECRLPFYFTGKIDEMVMNIDLGLSKGIIIQAGPYYKYREMKILGRANLRQHFTDNPIEYENFVLELGV